MGLQQPPPPPLVRYMSQEKQNKTKQNETKQNRLRVNQHNILRFLERIIVRLI